MVEVAVVVDDGHPVGLGGRSDQEVRDPPAAEPAIGELTLDLRGASEVPGLDLDSRKCGERTDESVELGGVSR